MLDEGWYIPSPSKSGRARYPRWLLGERDGICIYSKGGTKHYSCQARTFQKWIKSYGAKKAKKRS